MAETVEVEFDGFANVAADGGVGLAGGDAAGEIGDVGGEVAWATLWAPGCGFLWKNGFMTRPFAATVWREGEWYVSQCLEVDVASQGRTEEEALANLKEALELHFEPPQATRPPMVRTVEVEIGAA